MTGTDSSRGRIFPDFESYRNQEWIRRRKLRIEQVRKQTNDLAKTIRQKAVAEERSKFEEYERMRDANFRDWKAEKLYELEQKLRSALEEFGQGYKEAEAEPDAQTILEERNKMNQTKARKRGEIAKQEELRRRKLEEEKKMSPIQRKRMTRKLEDLRSALIRSVLVKNQLSEKEEEYQRETHDEDSQVKKITLIKKKVSRHDQEESNKAGKKAKKKKHEGECKLCKRRNRNACTSNDVDTIWVDLNDVQISDVEVHHKKCKQCGSCRKGEKENGEGVIEFFDYPSRCYSKSFREFPHLVERIDSDSEPNARELAKMEEENERIEAQKRIEANAVSQERGMEALRREKIARDYNNMIARLEELNKKEKIIKAQQHISSSLVHMNDARLSERMKTRQRMMDSKFESIYYEATARIPETEPPRISPPDRSAGGDYVNPGERISTRLSFSPSNLKTNSPVTPEKRSPVRTSPGDIRRFRNSPNKRQLLSEVERTLREGRKLREATSRKCSDAEKSVSSEDAKSVVEYSPRKSEKTTKSQESQTDDAAQVTKPLEVEPRMEDDSLPLSTSTSYKSPPSVIRSYRLRQFLEYLEGVSEGEDVDLMKFNPKFRRKMKKLLNELLEEMNVGDRVEPYLGGKSHDPTLKYYVEKLLNMSRECVANLSVSSENISTPNITDLDTTLRVDDEVDSKSLSESERSRKTPPRGEDLIRRSRLSRAEKLEEAIKNWNAILERNIEEKEAEDEPDGPQERGREEDERKEMETYVLGSPKVKTKYDEITKKCSERIWELSAMLDKVRRDKERLLSSTSDASSLCLSKTHSERGSGEEEEVALQGMERKVGPQGTSKTSPVLENFINRYNLSRPGGEENASTTAVADSHSYQDKNESLESWPDVMDELLKRGIITSPFKWSEGEFSSELTVINEELKPSSIETVIGNFRKEMSRIKPFSLVSTGLSPREASEEKCKDSLRSFDGRTSYQEESSIESINHALTSLGLNWAKSFLRKNEESKAITSSSSSSDEGKSSEEEEEKYFYHRKSTE